MFKKDIAAIKNDILDARIIITRRRKEIESLVSEGKKCKNNFRMTCIAQEVARLKNELAAIQELVEELI